MYAETSPGDKLVHEIYSYLQSTWITFVGSQIHNSSGGGGAADEIEVNGFVSEEDWLLYGAWNWKPKWNMLNLQNPTSKRFLSVFGKHRRQQDPKHISVDPLIMFLGWTWKYFSHCCDRLIIPMLLKFESQKEKGGTDFKEIRFQYCFEWFPWNERRMGKFVAAAIMFTGP